MSGEVRLACNAKTPREKGIRRGRKQERTKAGEGKSRRGQKQERAKAGEDKSRIPHPPLSATSLTCWPSSARMASESEVMAEAEARARAVMASASPEGERERGREGERSGRKGSVGSKTRKRWTRDWDHRSFHCSRDCICPVPSICTVKSPPSPLPCPVTLGSVDGIGHGRLGLKDHGCLAALCHVDVGLTVT